MERARRVRIPTREWCWKSDVPHIHLPNGRVFIDFAGYARNYRRRIHLP
jgi:hypothetical protein